MQNYLICYDYETNGVDPNACEPVQLAACAIDTRRLEIVKDSVFCSMMKPLGIEDKERFLGDKKINDTLVWHSKNQSKTPEEIFKEWESAPDQKYVFGLFIDYCQKYNTSKNNSPYYGPATCGMNIRNFDNIITERLLERYRIKSPFWKRDCVDLLDLVFYWLSFVKDAPSSISMDSLREYFGIPLKGGHDAKKDIEDTSMLILKFLRLFKSLAGKIKFKDSCKQ